MTRLDVLKAEKKVINNLMCLSFNLKEKCEDYYNHEIECIEKYGSDNPVYDDDKAGESHGKA